MERSGSAGQGRAWVAATTVVLAFAVGLYVGRRVVRERAVGPFRDVARGEALGTMLGSEIRKRAAASAYVDPRAALAELDGYAWAPPSDPAPFVGSMPTPGDHANAHVDARGFRTDREVRMPKPAGLRRVFLTGGSNAFGSGAPSLARSVGGFLGEALGPGVETIVAANASWASTHERILIENRLSELAPDLVISFSGNNDVYWGWQGEDVMWLRTHADLLFADAVENARGGPPPVRAKGPPVEPALVAARLAKNVRLAAVALAEGKARYVFALQPTLEATGKRLSARERKLLGGHGEDERAYFARCYAELRGSLRALEPSMRFVDLSIVFDGLGEGDEIFVDAYHYGDRGNSLVATALAKALRADGEPPSGER